MKHPATAYEKRGKKYYRKNKTKILSRLAKNYRKDPSKKRDYMLQYKFGITLKEYKAILKKQGGLCAICRGKQRAPFKDLAVDHDHATKKVRGLLCNPCNRAIGMMKDNPSTLWNAALYLRRTE